MDSEVREWLLGELEPWLLTWDGLDGDDDTEEEDAPDLRSVVEALRAGNTKLTREAYNLILFHLWQISLGKESEHATQQL